MFGLHSYRTSPQPTKIPRSELRTLRLLVRRHQAPYAVVQRGRIVLLARKGVGTEQICRQLGCSSRNVRKWKAQFLRIPTQVVFTYSASGFAVEHHPRPSPTTSAPLRAAFTVSDQPGSYWASGSPVLVAAV